MRVLVLCDLKRVENELKTINVFDQSLSLGQNARFQKRAFSACFQDEMPWIKSGHSCVANYVQKLYSEKAVLRDIRVAKLVMPITAGSCKLGSKFSISQLWTVIDSVAVALVSVRIRIQHFRPTHIRMRIRIPDPDPGLGQPKVLKNSQL